MKLFQIKRLFSFFLRSEAVRQSAELAIGNSLTGLIMAVAMIVVSRVVGPELFGALSVSMAIMMIFSKGVDMGINQIIPRFLNQWSLFPAKSTNFLGFIIRSRIVLSILTLLAGFILIPLVVTELNFSFHLLLFWGLIGGIILGWYDHVSVVLTARHKFRWAAVLSVSQALIKLAGFLIILVLAGNWIEGYAAVYFLAPLIATVIMGLKFKDLVFAKPLPQISIMRKIKPYLVHAAIGSLSATLIANLDLLMVQRSLTVIETGVYAGANRISLFLSFVIAAFTTVLNNRVARYKEESLLKSYIIKSSLMVVVALIGFVAFLPLAPHLIMFTIGEEYLSGLGALIILIGNAFLLLALSPFLALFYSLDEPSFFSISGIVQVVVIVLGNLFFLDGFGLQAAAWTRLAATVVLGLVTFYFAFKSWSKRVKLLSKVV